MKTKRVVCGAKHWDSFYFTSGVLVTCTRMAGHTGDHSSPHGAYGKTKWRNRIAPCTHHRNPGDGQKDP